jgi:hypothetical protein
LRNNATISNPKASNDSLVLLNPRLQKKPQSDSCDKNIEKKTENTCIYPKK